MKLQLLVPFSIAVSVASFALIKIRVKEIVTEEKKAKFQDVKVRVTDEVLMELGQEKKNIEAGMQREKVAQEELQKTLNGLNNDAQKAELEACRGKIKQATDEKGAQQEVLKNFQAESTKEKADWEAEIAALNEKLNTISPICQYLKSGSTLPQICPEIKQEPKAEPPKPEEEKKEPPKPEEEKKEAPKPEEEKKPEPPNADAPKQEAPK